MKTNIKNCVTKNTFKKIRVIEVLTISLLLGACSSTPTVTENTKFEELLPADEMLEGGGIFSGEKGEFIVASSEKRARQQTLAKQQQAAVSPEITQSSVSNLNLNQTSKVLDDKIKQLEKDQIELELLKSEIDKRLQAQ